MLGRVTVGRQGLETRGGLKAMHGKDLLLFDDWRMRMAHIITRLGGFEYV
jgi:hypothetical protein